jgi:DNA polymerase-3 subunit gamma/tau
LEATAAEDAPAAFALVERAIERGYDLRLLCRELARATRDLLILSVDPKRASDPDVAAEGERDRLVALAAQYSREDLLRAFDLLTKAEQEVRVSDQPRYNLEMALLRLMHLRKLVPLGELLGLAERAPTGKVPSVPKVPNVSAAAAGGRFGATSPKLATDTRASEGGPRGQVPVVSKATEVPKVPRVPVVPRAEEVPKVPAAQAGGTLKDSLLSEIKSAKPVFYNVVVAAAYRIDVAPGSVRVVFQPNQKVARQQCDEQRAWLQGLAEKVMGPPVVVSVTVNEAGAAPAPPPTASPVQPARSNPEDVTRDAMSNATVQAVLEIFPVEKTTVEEI